MRVSDLPLPGPGVHIKLPPDDTRPNKPVNPLGPRYPYKIDPLPDGLQTYDEVVRDLRRLLGKEKGYFLVEGRGDEGYDQSVSIFNGAIRSAATAVVKPTNAGQVSKTIRYCREHDLHLSVKAGGTGVHGQSIAGHIILDLCLMTEITVSLPTPSAVTLHDSFAQLHLASERSSPTKSTEPVYLYKRSANVAGVDVEMEGSGNGEASKRKRDLQSIRDGGVPFTRPGRSGAGSSSGSGSGSSADEETSQSFGGRTGSGSSSRSSRSLYDGSTPATSLMGSEGQQSGTSPDKQQCVLVQGTSPLDVPRAVSTADTFVHPPHRSSSSSSSTGRTTYINPSPVISHSFTSPPSSSSFSSSSMFPPELSFTSSYSNTNPSPPPYTLVTFGAGTHSKLLDSTTARSPYGSFYVPTSAFPVGSGQFLLGGFGFIGRKHGLAMDNVVEAEVVLADGRIVWVGEHGMAAGEWAKGEDPEELWWGLRGAGPALGVVTRYRAKAYYLPSVYAGNFIYVFDKATAPSLLRHVRDCIKDSPRTLYANIIMTAGPPGAPAIIVIQLCFSGSREEGEHYVQMLGSWSDGRCLFQDFSERSFERQQVAVEEVLKGGHGKKWYIKSDMIESLPDDVIQRTCDHFSSVPDGCTWLCEFTGNGAVGDVTDSCYPQSHRKAMFTVAALHQWAHDEPPAMDTKCVVDAEEWINEIIKPVSIGGPLPCFLQSSTPEDVQPVYGKSYPRLLALKKKMDPEGFFCHSMFPRPHAPDEWDQLPPLTQARMRRAHAETERLRAKEKGLEMAQKEFGI